VSQRLAPRAVRRDTVATAESARRSSLAERASRRSAVTARRWTRNRANGSAMAISSHLRSLADRKTHISSVPSPDLQSDPRPTAGGSAVLLQHIEFRARLVLLRQAVRRSRTLPAHRAAGLFSSLPAPTVLTGLLKFGRLIRARNPHSHQRVVDVLRPGEELPGRRGIA
jgi:hypothetical protein